MRTTADKHTMAQQWWQETAEELAAKVRGYFTNAEGKVDIRPSLDGDLDLYQTASKLTTRIEQPGLMSQPRVKPSCPACHCLVNAHHGPKIGCEGAGGGCFCSLTEEQATKLAELVNA